MKTFKDQIQEKFLQALSLGIKSTYIANPVIERLNLAVQRYNEGDRVLSYANAAQVQLLFEELEFIKQRDTELFSLFKKELRKDSIPHRNYFGLRLEIHTCWSLMNKKVSFVKSETPDFIASYNGEKIGLECTSAHVDLDLDRSEKAVAYRVLRTMGQKNKDIHSTQKIILAVDVSNLLFHEGANPEIATLADRDVAAAYFYQPLKDSKFLSLIYSAYCWFPITMKSAPGVKLDFRYWRIDRHDIDKTSKDFLDSVFPIGNSSGITAHVSKGV